MNSIPPFVMKLGPIVFLVAVMSVPIFYAKYRSAPMPKKPLSVAQYLFAIIVFGVLAFFAGSYAGISIACGEESAGNLCGLMGVLGLGPMFCGVAMMLTAHVVTRRACMAP